MSANNRLPITAIRVDPERLPIRRHPCPRRVDLLATRFRDDPSSVPPVLVWADPDNPKEFLLVSGRHRLEAAHASGVSHLAVALVHGTEADVASVAHMELTRPGRRGSPWDAAQAVRVLHEKLGCPSVRLLAVKAGRGRTQVSRYLKVGQELSEGDVRKALHEADLDPGSLHRLSLDCLYKVARSDETVLARRTALLVSEIRSRTDSGTRIESTFPGSSIRGVALAAAHPVWKGIGIALALAAAVRLVM